MSDIVVAIEYNIGEEKREVGVKKRERMKARAQRRKIDNGSQRRIVEYRLLYMQGKLLGAQAIKFAFNFYILEFMHLTCHFYIFKIYEFNFNITDIV